MKKTIICLLSGALVLGCSSESNNSNSDAEIVSALADDENTDSELKAKLNKIEQEEAKRLLEEESNVTSLRFDRLSHDFGDVKGESDNETVFVVTNTGKKPLLINDVKASCGCTTPQKPEGPIMPGKSDKIKVNFRPNAGQKDEITKTITVIANTDPRITSLSIRAFVK